MASMTMTMTPSFFAGSAVTPRLLPATPRRSVMPIRASKNSENMEVDAKEESNNNNNTKRGLMFAVAAAAVCSVAKVAMADEPKRGTAEAKKKYAPICVTMPTARICRN